MQDLNDMMFFAEVVDRGGFAAAGRALGIPKSRLSRRIAELEDRLGVRLLPPCVQTGGADFALDAPDAIRVGLREVRGLGTATVQQQAEVMESIQRLRQLGRTLRREHRPPLERPCRQRRRG